MSAVKGELRVLVAHNAYQLRGGEDSVVDAEVDLLKQHGHEVALLTRHNDDVAGASKLGVAAQALWSHRTTQELSALIERFRPDVLHVHNTWPLISPSIYWAAGKARLPVVQTLHNFRLMCPQATFLRDGAVCEDCLGKLPLPALKHRCYRESAVQTGALVGMLAVHRGLRTFDRKVSRYIALNQFCRSKFIAGGFPADRVDVKPNFVPWVSPPDVHGRRGGLSVGRLSVEKGVEVLLSAVSAYPAHQLTIIGGGPFEAQVQAVAGQAFVGFLPLSEVMQRLAQASYLVLPSVCYEGFPRTLVEAFASGVPVIASRLGSMAELISDGRTGLLFNPGDAADFVAKLKWADAHPQEMARMGSAARAEYESRYSPDQNYRELISIYERAIGGVSTDPVH